MRITRARFKPDHGPRGMGGKLMSDEVSDLAIKAAREIAALAAGLQDKESGELAGNYKVRQSTWTSKSPPNVRRSALVVNDKRYAAAVEFGKGRKGGNHALRRAGGMVGELREVPD